MKFLVDENVDRSAADDLARSGYDVAVIGRDHPRSLADREILALARQEGRILITNDHDFGELIFRQGLPHAGVIFLRLENDTGANVLAWLHHVIDHHTSDLGQFIVVSESGVRVRRTPYSP